MTTTATYFDTTRKVLENLPSDWVELTTHRLDTYDERQAKFQFLEKLHALQQTSSYDTKSLESLPSAYDYTRLGHPLSCLLEWLIGEINQLPAAQVLTFSSRIMPILAILRKNLLSGVFTHIYYDTPSTPLIDTQRLETIYGYRFKTESVNHLSQIQAHPDARVIFVTESLYKAPLDDNSNIDVTINLHPHCGSTIIVHNIEISNIVEDIQHVRRRETIAMSPRNALNVLHEIVNDSKSHTELCQPNSLKRVHDCIEENTGSKVTPLIASSGLSIQYAMMMGLVEDAMTSHPGKQVDIIIPPNCYGGTNDQARRIAESIPAVEIVDLLVDNGQNLVKSLNTVLQASAESDSIPIILVEIPTNPRVEVPEMDKLSEVLLAQRETPNGTPAVPPIITVDQTFCPNVKLLHPQSVLAGVKTVSYSSGSKFPSGGRCIAGFCTTNEAAKKVHSLIEKHLRLTDNGATANQLNILAENMPSMPARIQKAYNKTRKFVEHIATVLPDAKINFISHDLAQQGFTPSVFSLDLPLKGDKDDESHKKELNEKLIKYMIAKNPEDCKNCVSYGQLKGSYWTIPATSTQGTTKEVDKDYIVRVALSSETNIDKLAMSFNEFCLNEGLN